MMKKIILSLCVVTAMTACGSGDSTAKTDSAVTSADSAAKAIADTAVKKVDSTVSAMADSAKAKIGAAVDSVKK